MFWRERFAGGVTTRRLRPTALVVSQFHVFGTLVHFYLPIIQGEGAGLVSFSYRLILSPTPLVEESAFSPRDVFGNFVKNKVTIAPRTFH